MEFNTLSRMVDDTSKPVVTNAELAKAYGTITLNDGVSQMYVRRTQNRIAGIQGSIADYYAANKTLKGIQGIGPGVGKTLEFILLRGLDKAVEISGRQVYDGSPWHAKRSPRASSPGQSADNSAKIREG